MPYSNADLSLILRDQAAADNTMILARHALRDSFEAAVLDADWRLTPGSFAAGSDDTDANAPTSLLHDAQHVFPTKPDAGATLWYILVDFGAANLATIDHIYLGGHNFVTANVTSVNVQIADDSAFTTNLVTIATFVPVVDGRLVSLALDHTATVAQLYSSVQFLRLEINMSSGAVIPELSELITGQRIQFPSTPLVGYDPTHAVSEVSDFISRSGVTSRYVFHKGKQALGGTMMLKTAAELLPAQDWWDETQFGTQSFVWVEGPASAPDDAAVYLMDPEFVFPHLASDLRRQSFDIVEQPGFIRPEILARP